MGGSNEDEAEDEPRVGRRFEVIWVAQLDEDEGEDIANDDEEPDRPLSPGTLEIEVGEVVGRSGVYPERDEPSYQPRRDGWPLDLGLPYESLIQYRALPWTRSIDEYLPDHPAVLVIRALAGPSMTAGTSDVPIPRVES